MNYNYAFSNLWSAPIIQREPHGESEVDMVYK